MLSHYVDFKVVDGATTQDIALVHGYILSASHAAKSSLKAFDFPKWRDNKHAGDCLRIFAASENLEVLLAQLKPLLKSGAASHDGIKEVPSDAPLSDFVYKRVRTFRAHSSSHQRRQTARNPDVPRKHIEHSKQPIGAYRLIMRSQSNGQTYPLYIKRTQSTNDNDTRTRNGLNVRVPVIKPSDTKPIKAPAKIVAAQSATRSAKDDLPIYVEKKPAEAKKTSKHPLLEQIETVFGKQGLIVRDGGHHNPAQLQYALAVAETLLSTRSDNAPPIGLLEAATGVGKTLGYLVPALLHAKEHGARVVVSTYTKHLQHQLYSEDAVKASQYIEELTGQAIQISRRFGKSNYLSLTACDNYLDQIKEETGDAANQIRDFVVRVKKWAKKVNKALIPLDEYLDHNGLDGNDIPSALDYSMLAIGVFSNIEEIESYEAIIDKTNNADLLIVNHALSIINARSWMNVLEGGERKDIYIFDEADKLESAASSIACKNISIRQALKAISTGVSQHSKSRAASASAAIGQLEELTAAELKSGNNECVITPQMIAIIKDLLNSTHDAAFNAGRSILLDKDSFDKRLVKAEFLDSYNTLSYAVSLIEQGAPSLISASPIKKYPRLIVGQDKPARVLSRLWAVHKDHDSHEINPVCSSIGLIFTSATLRSRNGQFKQFAYSVGINDSVNKATGLPYHNAISEQWLTLENTDFGKMEFVLPDQRIPLPTVDSNERNESDEKVVSMSPRWLDYTASMIEKAQKQKGRTLVLTNSYKASCELQNRLTERGLSNVVTHKKGENLNHYLPQFLAHENSILLSHGAWEGLNLPNSISHIVIPRIPYSPPNDGHNRLRELALHSKGVSREYAKRIALSENTDNVVRKLTQGVGRGIRCKTDSVTIWLADPRFPMPDTYLESFDPILMKAPKRQRKDLRGFIPKRFIGNYNTAPIFIDGDLHKVEL